MQNAKDFGHVTKLKQLSWTERWMDGQTERQSDETDRQTDKPTCTWGHYVRMVFVLLQ